MMRILQLFASNYEENKDFIRITAASEVFEETYGTLLISQFRLDSKSLKVNDMGFRAINQESKLSEVVLSCLFTVIPREISTPLLPRHQIN